MFSENEKISGRQLYRSIIVTLAGPTLLVCPGMAAEFGSDGFFVYAVAGVLSVLYIWLMLFIRKKVYANKAHDSNAVGGYVAGKAFINTLLCVKLLVPAVIGLYLICDVVAGILLPETHIIVILAVLVTALIYWNQGSIESSARAFEVLFYWVLVPVIIVVGMAMPKVEVVNLVPELESNVGDIVAAGVLMWFLFAPAELLVLCGKHFKNDKKTTRGIWRGVLVLFVGNLVTYGTILGIYGGAGIGEGSPYPLLKVMQISGVPGDFLKRVDGFMSVFLVLSLFCEMVLLLDYMGISIWEIGEALYGKEDKYAGNDNIDNRKNKGNLIGKLKKRRKLIFSCVVTVLMAVAVMIIRREPVDEQTTAGVSEPYGEKKVISSVELEERAFVMSVIIGEKTVIFEIASDETDKWQEESSYVTLQTDTVEEAERLYKNSGEKRLDFSHMKMIFIEKSIYESGASDINLKYMYEQERFAENILVCPLDGDLPQMAVEAVENEEALAVKVERIMENSGRNDGMELYRVYGDMKGER